MGQDANPAEAVLKYWFGSNPDDSAVAAEKSKLWWKKNPQIDEEIRQRFQSHVDAAGRGELSHLASTARGRLALILLTDQFPRNIYRGTAQAFAYDPIALSNCLEALADGSDLRLRPIERAFIYLPLEHSESLEHQDRSVALFTDLANNATEAGKPTFLNYLDFAIRHREIIARFGRFPHRNEFLGRDSTPEEIEFLTQPGSKF